MDRLHTTDEGTTERDGDTLRGGRGDDRLVPGRDTRAADDVNLDTLSWEDASGPVRIDVASGSARGRGNDSLVGRAFWVVGSAYGDVIDGSGRGDHIIGGPGSDVIRGLAGADRIVADNGAGSHGHADVVHGGRGADQISAMAGQDRLYGGPGPDVIDDFGNSADVLAGGDGNDLLVGQLSAVDKPQSYSGGAGHDDLSIFTNLLNPGAAESTGTWDMASGAMTFTGDATVTLTVEGFESADFSTYGTAWDVDGTTDADALFASGTSGTVFNGHAGDDRFMGSFYDDRFVGGPGHDRSLGMGFGNDTCVGVEAFDANDCEHMS
jgi:Ca2+-binding RTX toxin-like protein